MSTHPRVGPVALAVLVAAIATGCAVRATEGDPVAVHSSGLATPSVATSETPSTAAPVKSPRGAILKALGEPAALCTDDACTEFAVTFTVDKIEADVKCTEAYAEPPENGHYIALDLTIKTTDKFTEDMAYAINFTAHAFQIVGPDGITEQSDPGPGAYGCLPDTGTLPTLLSPSSQYATTVVLDSKHSSGILLLRWDATSFGGWEWEF